MTAGDQPIAAVQCDYTGGWCVRAKCKASADACEALEAGSRISDSDARLVAMRGAVREIHEVMKRGKATQDHGLDGNLACILDGVLAAKEHAAERTRDFEVLKAKDDEAIAADRAVERALGRAEGMEYAEEMRGILWLLGQDSRLPQGWHDRIAAALAKNPNPSGPAPLCERHFGNWTPSCPDCQKQTGRGPAEASELTVLPQGDDTMKGPFTVGLHEWHLEHPGFESVRHECPTGCDVAYVRNADGLEIATVYNNGAKAIAERIVKALNADAERTVKMPDAFRFDRYHNGELMAEGVTITKATDEQDALRRAQAMFHGDTFVLRTELPHSSGAIR